MRTNPEDMTEAEQAYWEGRAEEHERLKGRIAELEKALKKIKELAETEIENAQYFMEASGAWEEASNISSKAIAISEGGADE